MVDGDFNQSYCYFLKKEQILQIERIGESILETTSAQKFSK